MSSSYIELLLLLLLLHILVPSAYISIHVRRYRRDGMGRGTGVVGPNGAGKTTLVKMLVGRDTPDEGRVVLGETVKVALVAQDRWVDVMGCDVMWFSSVCCQ